MATAELKLLLVEDSPSDARLVEEYLRERRWSEGPGQVPDLVRASRLEDVTEAQSEESDLVLLDLDLPDSTGLDTLQSVLATVGSTPVVVLTGLDDQQLGVRAVERGAQDYLPKDDVSPALLQRTIQYALERARQQRELRRRNRELAVLNQVVRHDIRSDVSVVVGWGDTLGDYVEPGGEEYLSRMLDAAEHITQLTETVGDFLQILEGERDAELRPYNLVRVLRSEVEKARSAHGEAAFVVEGDPPDELTVEANEMLSSVFRALLNNAVAGNDEEPPEVTVTLEADADTVRVAVADDGPGVPGRHKEEVFGRGQRGLESPGSDVGLHLVDTLVDLFGGAVQVADNEPEGSVYTVELPRA